MLNELNDESFVLTIYDYFAIPAALLWFLGGVWLISVTIVRYYFIEHNKIKYTTINKVGYKL